MASGLHKIDFPSWHRQGYAHHRWQKVV